MGIISWAKKQYKTYRAPPTPTAKEIRVVEKRAEEARKEPEIQKAYPKFFPSGRGAPVPTPTAPPIVEVAPQVPSRVPSRVPTPSLLQAPPRTIAEQLQYQRGTRVGRISETQGQFEKRMGEIRRQEAMAKGIIAPAPFWYKKYPSKVKGAVFELEKGAEQVISMGGLLQYRPTKVPSPFQPQIAEAPPGITGRGTAVFRLPTEREMTPEQKVRSVSEKAGTTAYFKSEVISKRLSEKYQTQISRGEISLAEAERKYKKEYTEKLVPIQKKYQTKVQAAQKIHGLEVMRAARPLTFAKGAVFGGISALAPPIGLGLAGVGIGATAFRYGRPGGLRETFRAYPGETVTQFGLGLAGAGVGALGTGFAFRGVRGYVRTFAKEPIGIEKLVRPSVIKGKQLFPTAPTKAHLRLFKTSKYKLPKEQIKIVKRVSPEKYLKLQKDIKFKIEKLPKEEFGRFYGIKRELILAKGVRGKERQITIAHELIHAKTPKPIIKISKVFPYELKPSELLAFGLEKSLAKKGFKVTRFKEPKFAVWHTTPEKFAKEFVVRAGKKRSGEPTGLFVSPEVSPYFLRTAPTKYKLFGLGLESPLGKRPTITRIYPKGIVKGIKGRVGYAELPLTKPEIQAVMPVSTQLQRVGAKYYTTWRGERIPIIQYEVLGKGRAPPTKAITTLGKISKKYYYQPSAVPLVTPSSLAYSLRVSKYYKPSKISYYRKPYGISYKPSVVYKAPYGISYKPSLIPYKPIGYRPTTYYRKPYPYKPTRYYREPYLRTQLFPPVPPPTTVFRMLESKRTKPIRKLRKVKPITKYTPSLVGSILQLKITKKPYVLKSRPGLGFLPGVRGILIKKKKK